MNVELTLSRSASFVSSIIDPSAFFVHFFNSFLLILKILVRDDLRRSQIETRYSKGDKEQLTNSSPLAQKAKESLKSSSVKVKLNKWILLLTFGPASVCVPESHNKVAYDSEAMNSFNLPGGKFNSFMKILHFSMWLVCISIDTSIEIFVESSFEFFLFATQNICLTLSLNVIHSFPERSVKTWTVRCPSAVSRGRSVTWPVLKTVQNEIGWKVHLIH